jgi:hypothetical protein
LHPPEILLNHSTLILILNNFITIKIKGGTKMKTNTLTNMVVIVLLFFTIITFTSCQKEKSAQLQPAKTELSSLIPKAEKIAVINYVYLVGEEPIEGPDKTVAPNGDTITIKGSGTFSTDRSSISGEGSFQHTDAAGNLLASGTWEAIQLLSFVSWGTSPILPQNFEAGKAFIRIHLSPDGGGEVHDAILQISCVLPESNFPPGFDEGIRLVVPQVANFNDPVHGQTLFIRQ